MEIIPNVHLIPNIVANPYLIVDPDGLTLIDAGLPGNQKKILKTISSLGHTPTDLKRIIITHADIDHIGSLSALKKASGAQILTSKIEAEAMAQGKSSRQIQSGMVLRKVLMGIMLHFMPPIAVEADVILKEGQILPVLGGLRVVETPGHTPGHISLFSPSTGILFTGDSIVTREGELVRSVKANTWDEAKADESARKQAALGAQIVCPGHGAVIKEAANKFPKF
jgi:glyoxylase-like metal-dependent hydrolase (beta-lactamase superfamily II)